MPFTILGYNEKNYMNEREDRETGEIYIGYNVVTYSYITYTPAGLHSFYSIILY